MKWLLWKDYRNNRVVVFAALAFLLTPHLSALIVSCRQYFCWHNSDPRLWVDNFAVSSVFGLIVSQLAIAVIAGNAIAGERADRAAEFLASLPITRRRILASKLLLSLAIVAVIWGTDAPALLCLKGRGTWQVEVGLTLGYTAATTSVLFSVAWCLSSFLASPTFAVAGGLLTPVVLWFSIICALLKLDVDNEHFECIAMFWYCAICLTLALVCFGVGTWHYLRRVEP